MSDTTKEEPLSHPEMVEKYIEKMTAFYEQQIPFLETQFKFEKLSADIAEQRARRVAMEIRHAEMTTPPPAPETPATPPAEGETPKRNLRTE